MSHLRTVLVLVLAAVAAVALSAIRSRLAVLGLLFTIQDGLSVSGLQQLAGAPRPDEEAVR